MKLSKKRRDYLDDLLGDVIEEDGSDPGTAEEWRAMAQYYFDYCGELGAKNEELSLHGRGAFDNIKDELKRSIKELDKAKDMFSAAIKDCSDYPCGS